MTTSIDIIAKELQKIQFNMPGAGGLKGKLTLSGGIARDFAEAAVTAIAMPKTQEKAIFLSLPKYQRDYIESLTRLGPSSHELLVKLIRLGIDVHKNNRPNDVALSNLADVFERCKYISSELERCFAQNLPYPTLPELDSLLEKKFPN